MDTYDQTNKIRILLIVTVTFIMLFLLSGQGMSKCAYELYKITGTVQDTKTKTLIPQAKLFFFFDDEQGTLAAGYKTEYPDFFMTDDQGSFMATAYFDTYSGFLAFDLCNKVPKILSVIVTAQGYLTKRMVFHMRDLKVVGEPFNRTIQLPPIEINK